MSTGLVMQTISEATDLTSIRAAATLTRHHIETNRDPEVNDVLLTVLAYRSLALIAMGHHGPSIATAFMTTLRAEPATMDESPEGV